MTFKNLVALSFDFYEDKYEKNKQKLIKLINKAPTNSLIVAPELCLTNFSFSKQEEAFAFSKNAIKQIKELSTNKTISFSYIAKENNSFFNRAIIIQNKKIIYQRDKYKLFKFGKEDIYFAQGKKEDIKIVNINNTKVAILICFEIRFIDLWEKIKGADIILVPALWGKARKKQLEIISNALGVINQCYVIVANSKNKDMASSSAIISPFGKVNKNDKKNILIQEFDKKEILKMRRYMDVGIR